MVTPPQEVSPSCGPVIECTTLLGGGPADGLGGGDMSQAGLVPMEEEQQVLDAPRSGESWHRWSPGRLAACGGNRPL
jgi:hypothetical protein